METKALVIDLDGTLYPESKEHIVDEAGSKRIHKMLKGKTAKKSTPKALLERVEYNLNRGIISESSNTLGDIYGIPALDIVASAYDLNPHAFGIGRDTVIVESLSELQKRFKIYLFTNSPLIWVNRVIETIGVEDIIKPKNMVSFETLDNGRILKPHKEAFIRMLEKTKMPKNQILFLDNNKNNIDEAARLGIEALWIQNEGTKPADSYTIHSALDRIKSYK